MFDSLDEQIKHDNALEVTPRERIIKGVAIVFLSVVLFGGLYYAVRMMQ
ncbi:MAG TPA: hypothetical protein VGH38_10050 [Bryobacteraceae bacterium]|jgi:hypothetical protein